MRYYFLTEKTSQKPTGQWMAPMNQETEEKLENAIVSKDFETFVKTLSNCEPNYKSITALRRLVNHLGKRKKIEWMKKLQGTDNVILMVTISILIEKTKYWNRENQYVYDIIEEYAKHENWNIRQASVDLFVKLISDEEENALKFFDQCVKIDDLHLKRLALLVGKKIARSSYYEDELKKKLLHKIDPLIYEDDPYIITVSTECFAEGFLKNCTDMTFDWINQRAEEVEDPQAISQLILISSSSSLENHTDEALEVVEKFLKFDNPQIKKARSTALHQLANKKPNKVSHFLETRLDIKQAVDHWAELEADGTLNNFNY